MLFYRLAPFDKQVMFRNPEQANQRQPTVPVVLRRPTLSRAGEFLDAVARSRRLHGSWVSPPDDKAHLDLYLRSLRSESREGYFVCRADTDALVGVINISEIVRGCFLSGYLGYYAFTPSDGHGFMRQGLSMVLERAFGGLGLHRLEANIQPANERSISLVDSLGFVKEGESRRYLMINGHWCDHHRYALLAEDWIGSR